MYIKDFIQRLNKIEQSNIGFKYSFGKQITESDLRNIEIGLNLNIPLKIKQFYLVTNGLITTNPDFTIVDINNWVNNFSSIHFATFNDSIPICFDTTELNSAGEWTILNKETNYKITLSISSFWSNKVWHWLEKRRKIWDENWEAAF